MGAGDEKCIVREGSRTRRAEEMVRTSVATIGNMPFRNETGDILLAPRKWGIIPSVLKQKKRQDCLRKGSRLQDVFLFQMWKAAQVWLSAPVKREVRR